MLRGWLGTSLLIQWLRLIPNAGGMGSIPGQGTKIPYAHGTAKKKKKRKKKRFVTLGQNTVYWIWQQRNSLVTLATTVSEERKK